MRRSIAAILAVPTLLNGLAMLVAGPFWYASVPGVTATGPFNPHFVQDIGVAFLVAGLALAARAWRPRYWPAAVAGAGFLAAHALIHLVAIIGGHDHEAMFDLLAVVLPSALALYSAFPAQENIMRSWIARRMLRAADKRYGYDTSYLEMMLRRVAGRILQVRAPGEGGKPSRSGSGRSKLCGQDRRRPGGGLRSLHPTLRRHGAGSRHAEGPDRGGPAP